MQSSIEVFDVVRNVLDRMNIVRDKRSLIQFFTVVDEILKYLSTIRISSSESSLNICDDSVQYTRVIERPRSFRVNTYQDPRTCVREEIDSLGASVVGSTESFAGTTGVVSFGS